MVCFLAPICRPVATNPSEQLCAAYDDEHGVTAAFNRNILVRLNRELGANFQPDGSSMSPCGTAPSPAWRCT